jgi:serine/threonine-protein kinase
MTAPLPEADMFGKLVAGKYRVERLVGQGAMGSVWAARHVSLGHAVAIKFIHPDLARSPTALRRFETEARAAAKLKSRHVVQVYDHGIADAQPYIVMEYLEGRSLESIIREQGALPPDDVIALIGEAAVALEVAHAAGVIHRDLKPDNIMLANDAESKPRGYVVKLVDFGIAKLLTDVEGSGAGTTRAGVVLGTPFYMSPEALTASTPVGAQSDVWSLGACAFAAMVGKTPFEGEAIGDVVLKVCAAPLPVPSAVGSGVPAGFDEWFAKACHRDPARRFASAREMGQALRQLDRMKFERNDDLQFRLRPTYPSIHDVISIPPPPTPSRTRMAAGVVLGVSLTTGVLGLFVYHRTEDANRATLAAASAAASVAAENERRASAAAAAVLAASQRLDAAAPADPGRILRIKPSRREKRP